MAQDRLSCFEFFVLGACAPLCESLPLALIIYFAYFAFLRLRSGHAFAAKSLLSFGCGLAALGLICFATTASSLIQGVVNLIRSIISRRLISAFLK